MPQTAVKRLWQSVGLPANIPEEHLQLLGNAFSTLPSSFNLGVAAQASIAVSGLSASYLQSLNTHGKPRKVTVDAHHAAVEFASEKLYTINGTPPGGLWDDIAGTYPTKDNSFVRIHTNFPHHKAGILSILGLPSGASKQNVTEAILQWDSKKFEDEAATRGMCATAFRSFQDWDNHPHAHALRNTPPVQLIKIGEAPKRMNIERENTDNGPLNGARVLDLTRVIAGPVCGRTLAAYGADTLWVTSPNLPSLPHIDSDTSRGKRTTQLDLTKESDHQALHYLIKDADVFLQAYRPNGLQEKGFGPIALAKLRPGIVCANLRAWGWEGPWRDRRGFDSLVQTATGFNYDESVAYSLYKEVAEDIVTPKPFPVQALDHAAGYLLAFGIMSALCKTFTEGGSWEVRVSLVAVGQWIRSLGRIGPKGFDNAIFSCVGLSPEELHPFFVRLPLRIPRGRKEVEGSDETRDDKKEEDLMIAVKHAAYIEGISVPNHNLGAPDGSNIYPPMWLPSIG